MEEDLLRRAADLAERCERTATVTSTAFLTPAEQYALTNWARHRDCTLVLHGGKLLAKVGLTGRFGFLGGELIDLRGQTIEEGIMMVDQYIDSCLLMGIKTITIIHGKGTGALRNAIQQHLKNHKAVRSFRLGVYGEGENGVTIAELK